MATRENYKKMSSKERQYRYFSEPFKKQKVQEIERGLSRVAEVSKAYEVSTTAIYKWISKYGQNRERKERQVVELKSDTVKIQQLKEQMKELEHLVGQKQIQLDFLEKMLELASEHYGTDIKKKFTTKRSFSSGKKGGNSLIA